MKIKEIIEALKQHLETHGDLEVNIQSNPQHDGRGIVSDSNIYLVVEEYAEADGGKQVNLRTWPY